MSHREEGSISFQMSVAHYLTDQVVKKPDSRCKKCIYWFCQRLAANKYFSGLTTTLTLYALFGDDIRLMFTDRPADVVFDAMIMTTMFVFSTDIIACSIGQAGYLYGFFFFLDILSTVTLVLDITYVAEWLFGDSVSMSVDAQQSSGGGGEAGSAEAARAARMSRAGTKAGRAVRLIRLIRLIRLVKLFKRKQAPGAADDKDRGPGVSDSWVDDDEHEGIDVNESAVSKKLSEMTTRRVVILVLAILLIIPLFSSDMYKDALPNSAQYGIDGLYRRFRDDMTKFDPTAGPVQEDTYLKSTDREHYVNDLLLTIYFHNWFCDPWEIPSDKASPTSSFGKLFFSGRQPH